MAALSLLIGAFVASTPVQQAGATTSWPVTYTGARIMQVTAHGDDKLTLISCLNNGTDGAYYTDNGTIVNTLPSYNSSSLHCTGSQNGSGAASADGTFYTMKRTPSSPTGSALVAWKNGREKWAVDISSPTECSGSYYSEKKMYPASISVASDGMLYAILTPGVSPQTCPYRFISIDPDLGTLRFAVDLAIGVNGGPEPIAWTYDDKIIVLDGAGVLREYSRSGVENTGAQYTFAIPTGTAIYQSVADAQGNVFVGTYDTAHALATPPLMYHMANGDTGSFGNTGSMPNLVPDGYGNVDGVLPYSPGVPLNHFDTSTDTETYGNVPAPTTSGYSSKSLAGFVRDSTTGDILTVWDLVSSGVHTTLVDLYDVSASTGSNVATLSGSIPMTGYPLNALSESIADGNLYLSTCSSTINECYDTDSPAADQINKIDLGSFGDPVPYGYNMGTPYSSQKLNYVAMGDSYSSGEGNPDFNPWTDTSENKCHRSLNGYPELLAQDEDLNLELSDYVACSGATTGNVLSSGPGEGSWDEPIQINALSVDTDVVTLTVGGNDIGFKPYVISCVFAPCGPGSINSITYNAVLDIAESTAFMGNLQFVYESVLEAAPNADVYIINYPYLVDPTGSDTCTTLTDFSGAAPIQTALNDTIADAVTATRSISTDYHTRLHLVDTNGVGSSFENMWFCTDVGNVGFNSLKFPETEYSFHPNSVGQSAYYTLIKGYLNM